MKQSVVILLCFAEITDPKVKRMDNKPVRKVKEKNFHRNVCSKDMIPIKIFMFGFFLFLFKWKQNKDLFSGKQERSDISCLFYSQTEQLEFWYALNRSIFRYWTEQRFHSSLLSLQSTPEPHLCHPCGFSWLSLTDLYTSIPPSQPQCLAQNKLLLPCSDSILLLRA